MTNGALYCRMIHADTQRKKQKFPFNRTKSPHIQEVNKGKSDNHLPYQADFHKLCQNAEPDMLSVFFEPIIRISQKQS